MRPQIQPFLVSLVLAAMAVLMTLDWRKLLLGGFVIGDNLMLLIPSPAKFWDKSIALGLLAGIFSALSLAGRKREWEGPVWSRLLGVYVIYAGLSLGWSQDAFQSIQKFIGFLVCLAAVYSLVTRFSVEDYQDICWMAPILVVGVNLLTELAWGNFRPLTSGYRFHGFIHPNQLGMMLVVGLLALLFRSNRQSWDYPLLAGLLMLLMLTRSRTSIAALIATLGTLWLLNLIRTRALKQLMAVGGMGLTCVIVGALKLDWEKIDNLLKMGRENTGSIATLNGRLPLWESLMGDISQYPWLGYGYAGFWSKETVRRLTTEQGWRIEGAHNTILEVILGLGLIGLLLFSVIFLSAVYRGWRRWFQGESWALFPLAILLSGFFLGLLESNYARPGSLNSLLTYGCVLSLLCSRGEAGRQQGLSPEDRLSVWAFGLSCVSLTLLSQWDYLGNEEPLMAAQMAATLGEPSPLRVFSFVLLAGLGALLPQGRVGDIVKVLKDNPFLGGYLAICVLSLAWSEVPRFSAVRLLGLLCYVFVAMGLCTRFDDEQLTKLLQQSCGLLVVSTAALGLYYSFVTGQPIPARLGGSFHPNTFGALSGVWVLTLTASPGNRAAKGVWFALACVCLLASGSRASVGGTLIGLAVFGYLRLGYRTLFLMAALFPATYWALAGTRGGGGIFDLNGRFELWGLLIPEVESRPFLGHGYEAFWTPDNIERVSAALHWAVPSAHSAVFEVLLSTGLVGALLLGIFCSRGLLRLSRAEKSRTRDFSLALLVMAAVLSTVESTFVKPYTVYGLFTLSFLIKRVQETKE